MNTDIKELAYIKRVRMWELAKALNISDSTLTRWLRDELSEDKKKQIKTAIGIIADKKEKGFDLWEKS